MENFKETKVRVLNNSVENGNVFRWSNASQKLLELRPIKTLIKIDKMGGDNVVFVKYVFGYNDGGEEKELKIDHFSIANGNDDLYESVDAYNRGERIDITSIWFRTTTLGDCLNRATKRCHSRLNGWWSYVNNTPIYYDAVKVIKQMEVSGWTVKITECDVPFDADNAFETKDELMNYHSYIVRELDGTEHIEHGKYVPLLLTDEQKEAYEKVCDAIKAAKELGVRFVYDNDRCDLFAVNGKSIANICDCEYDKDKQYECRLISDYIVSGVEWYGCDDALVINKCND